MKGDTMKTRLLSLAAVLVLGVAGCQTADRTASTTPAPAPAPAPMTQADSTPSDPPGTVVSRTYDRVTGSNTSGAYRRPVRHRRARAHRRVSHRTYHRATRARTTPVQTAPAQ